MSCHPSDLLTLGHVMSCRIRCLAENMNDADFGPNCKYQIVYKLQRRQANWKLDPPLRKACRDDVREKCQAEDAKDSEDGLVYQCLIKKYSDIDSGCQKELVSTVPYCTVLHCPLG